MPKPNYCEVTLCNGQVVEIPKLHATDGMSLGGYNFAGPGWNSSQGCMAARPTCTFDFAAKIHDLHYCISNIDFKTLGDHEKDVAKGIGSARHRSHQHKADLIFRLMVNHTGEWGIGNYYSRTRFIHSKSEWALANDGFVNILSEPRLIAILKNYRMIPWSELTMRQKLANSFSLSQPRYAVPVDQDAHWYEWAQAKYRSIWGSLIAVR